MKRKVFKILFTLLMGVLIVSPEVFAYSINYSNIGDVVTFGNGAGTLAGEFTMKSADGSMVYNNTFCVETDQSLDFASQFEIRDIDVASNGAAYLYYHFVMGDLAGYSYTDNPSTGRNEHAISADALQRALWQLQGQSDGARNDFYYLAKSATAQVEYAVVQEYVAVLEMLKKEWVPEQRVCTTWGYSGCKAWTTIAGHYEYSAAQDVLGLIKDPTPPTQTPEPASLFLFGLGLMGLIGVGRKNKKRK